MNDLLTNDSHVTTRDIYNQLSTTFARMISAYLYLAADSHLGDLGIVY